MLKPEERTAIDNWACIVTVVPFNIWNLSEISIRHRRNLNVWLWLPCFCRNDFVDFITFANETTRPPTHQNKPPSPTFPLAFKIHGCTGYFVTDWFLTCKHIILSVWNGTYCNSTDAGITNGSSAHLSIPAISWHLFHLIHSPLCASMIKSEIKLFIILVLCPLLVCTTPWAADWNTDGGECGNDHPQKQVNFTAD